MADALGATRALLGETQQALLREARVLAGDPAVIEGVVKGDWATLAPGASPRILSVTRDRRGDLLVITDASRAPHVPEPAPPSRGGSPERRQGSSAQRRASRISARRRRAPAPASPSSAGASTVSSRSRRPCVRTQPSSR